MLTAPVAPTLDVPVLRAIKPLTPAAPAGAVFKLMVPLDVSVPVPDKMLTDPPLAAVPAVVVTVLPAAIVTPAPAPLPPDPTVRLRAPAVLIALPVARLMLPASIVPVPVVRATFPLFPAAPLLAVLSAIEPLEVAAPKPDASVIEPPDAGASAFAMVAVASPATRLIAPPTPTLPLPTLSAIAPPLPNVDSPD